MFGTTDLALFVVSGLILNVTPGPDTMYILGRSATMAFLFLGLIFNCNGTLWNLLVAWSAAAFAKHLRGS